jgi:hypothetical protein
MNCNELQLGDAYNWYRRQNWPSSRLAPQAGIGVPPAPLLP